MTRPIHTPRARFGLAVGLAAGALVLSACSMISSITGGGDITLTGANEEPPVATSATATGKIVIAADGAVSGSLTATGIVPTMGHIHQAAPGVNGPVIIPLTQNGNVFTVPAGAKLTETQLAAYKAGNLYVNIHSAAHPGGEIRVQLKPTS